MEKGAWVSLLALAETTWVLAGVYERSAADIATAVEMLLNHRTLTLQDPDVVAAGSRGFSDEAGAGLLRLSAAGDRSKSRASPAWDLRPLFKQAQRS